MKTFQFIFFILLIPLLFTYETSKFTYEKSWYITGEVGTVYDLNASFLVNDSDQIVSQVELSEGYLEKQGVNLLFFSEGNITEGEKIITASAIVEIKYEPFFDYDVPLGSISSPKNPLESQAYSLIDSSSTAKTLISFTDWVHDYIEYNTYYSDITEPNEIFEVKKGVCTAYANLLSYFLNYANIEVKQVSGYSETAIWLAHAWVEVKIGEEWISVDPTYNQIGIISSDHIKTYIGDSTMNDVIHAFGDIHNFSSDSEILQSHSKPLQVPIDYEYSTNNNTAEVVLSNPSNKYVFVSYYFLFPEGWGENINKILLLSPGEELALIHKVEPDESSGVDPSSTYSVPFLFSVMGEETEGTIHYGVDSSEEGIEDIDCPVSLFILLSSLIFLAKK